MNKYIIPILIIDFCLLILISCKKEDDNTDLHHLSIDSLKILQSDIPPDLYTDLTFTDEYTGYAISNSGAIIKTTDGGYTWVNLNSPVSFFLSEIQFTDSQTGYIIGGDTSGGYLLRTPDAGQRWEIINLHTAVKNRPDGMFFLDKYNGFVCGERLFIKTTDGGQTWSDVKGILSENINDVSFKDESLGYATSDDGKYLRSSNGGKTWQTMQSNTSDHLNKIYYTTSGSYAKCRTSVFMNLTTGDEIFNVPGGAFKFFFLSNKNCIGIGQHYETGFLPYGDVFLTNDAWTTYLQKKYNPQSEAMNVTAVALTKKGRILIIGCGTVNTSVIELLY